MPTFNSKNLPVHPLRDLLLEKAAAFSYHPEEDYQPVATNIPENYPINPYFITIRARNLTEAAIGLLDYYNEHADTPKGEDSFAALAHIRRHWPINWHNLDPDINNNKERETAWLAMLEIYLGDAYRIVRVSTAQSQRDRQIGFYELANWRVMEEETRKNQEEQDLFLRERQRHLRQQRVM